MSCTVREPSGYSLLLYCCRVYTVHIISVYSVCSPGSLSFACVDLSCWRCHSSEVLGPNWTKFSGNVYNNNAIPCSKFGILNMNGNVHSWTCTFMNFIEFIVPNLLGTTIRYYFFYWKLFKFESIYSNENETKVKYDDYPN